MKYFILPKGFVIGIAGAALICGGLQAGVRWCIHRWVVEKEQISCTVNGVEKYDGDTIQLDIDCAGKPMTTTKADVIISYFKNPGPIVCTTYKAGDPTCQPRNEKK